MLHRRRFLNYAGAILAAPALRANANSTLPTRLLGNTGLSVPVLGIGTADLHHMPRTDALALLDAAYRWGARLYDTAPEYGNGLAECLLGECLANRPDALMVGKTLQRDRDGAWRDLETSLDRLQRDRLDVWLLHDLRTDYEWGLIGERDGALQALLEAKSQGVVRAIGFSANRNPELSEHLLRSELFDAAMLPLGAGFEAGAFFAAHEAGVGLLGMKVFCAPGRKVMESGAPSDRLRQALNLPIACAVTGCENERQLRENIEAARV